MSINELPLVLTVDDYDRATALFRDALGLKQLVAWQNDGGHIVLLDASHATLEIIDERQARAIDEIEVERNSRSSRRRERDHERLGRPAGPPSRRS